MSKQTKADLEKEIVRLRTLYQSEVQKVRDLTVTDDWKRERTIDDEVAYPLFGLTASYTQDINPVWKHKLPYWQTQDVANGRIRNSSMWSSRGFREWPNQSSLIEWSQSLWSGALKKDGDYAITNPADVVLVAVFNGWAVWWLTWFQHETFDIGLDDADVLASFQRHCDREIRKAHHEGIEPCLMGAEDQWRWSGSEPNGSPPPCRCKHCKEAGLIRIGH